MCLALSRRATEQFWRWGLRMGETVLEVSTPKCVAEQFDDEIVVLNTETGVYFSIRGSGIAIWQALAEGHSMEAIRGAAEAASDGEARRFAAFVDDLLEKGLLRPAQNPAPPRSPIEPLAGAMFAGAPPMLETYQDMQDLLLLCPVHEREEEVEDAGPEARSLVGRFLSRIGR